MNEVSKEEGETLSLPDGRLLGYLIAGEGKPVFWFHGLANSRLDVLLLKGLVSAKRLQVIGVDRPGFGLSTFAPKRRLCDFAADVSFLAEHLGIDKFALAGVSQGGPYVITCAGLLAERVTRAVAISGLSSPGSPQEKSLNMLYDWGTIPIVGTIIVKKYRDTVLELAKDPDSFLESDRGRKPKETYSEVDAKLFVTTSKSRDIFLRSMVEAFRQGDNAIRALIQEFKIAKKGWDTDLSTFGIGLLTALFQLVMRIEMQNQSQGRI